MLGDYELRVQRHRYVNPTSTCQGCCTSSGVTCCDGVNLGNCTDHELCDNIFFHCLREAPSTECLQGFSKNVAFVDADDITSLVPLCFTVPGAWEVSAFSASCKDLCLLQGIQFFTRVWDDDGNPGLGDSDDVVDEFPINLTTSFLIPGAVFTERTVHNGSFGFGQFELSFKVSCAANFSGADCATECVHQCDTNGECMDEINSFCCECNAGFIEADCMTDINDCEGVDCGNGVCRDTGVNAFTCECNAGFTGADCMTDINDCEGVDCGNGVCRDTGVTAFTCECNAGFTGADCMTDINDCEGVDCGNGACRDTGVTAFTCECNAGFTGADCMTDINDCEGVDCGNGACRDTGVTAFTCECNAGFTGADCMTDINDCEGVDCGNGVCRDTGVNSFTCECNAGFTGSQCLTNIDDCVNASCGQNGECVDQINSFTCMCDTGFTGADCMTNIDDCSSANCSENSKCVDGVDSFSCVCSPGFEFNGTFCENAASQGTHIQGLSLNSVCSFNDSVFVFRWQSRKHLCRNWGSTEWTAWEHCSGIDLGLSFGDCCEENTAEENR